MRGNMFLTDETYRSVIVAAIQAQGIAADPKSIIEATVNALIRADRCIRSGSELTSATQTPGADRT